MRDSRLIMLMVGLAEVIRRDQDRGRTIGGQVLSELADLHKSCIRDNFEEAGERAREYVAWAYGEGPEPPWLEDRGPE